MADSGHQLSFQWNNSPAQIQQSDESPLVLNQLLTNIMGNLDNNITDLLFNASEPQRTPASQSAIASLQAFSYDTPTNEQGQLPSNNTTTCSVCMENFVKEDTLLKIGCGHAFHKDCLLPWLQTNNTCPVCRHELDATSDQTQEQIQEQERVPEEQQGVIAAAAAPPLAPTLQSVGSPAATAQQLAAQTDTVAREIRHSPQASWRAQEAEQLLNYEADIREAIRLSLVDAELYRQQEQELQRGTSGNSHDAAHLLDDEELEAMAEDIITGGPGP